jgi:hypothetical protein
MTTLLAPTPTATAASAVPARRTLVGLAIAFVALFVVGMATSKDPSGIDSPATVMKDFDVSHLAIQVTTAGGAIAAAVLVFFGAALKAALTARRRTWTASVVGYGFTLGGVCMLVFTLATLWLWHAVDVGEASAVRVFTIIDVETFPALMVTFATAYVAVGVTARLTKQLPTWLCVASIVIGAISPLGPAGFLAFGLFPIWLIVVAAMVKLDPGDVQPSS